MSLGQSRPTGSLGVSGVSQVAASFLGPGAPGQGSGSLYSRGVLCASEGCGSAWGESLVSLQPSGRFGSALAVLDFNKDGVPDLAVGAPSVGSEQLTYKVRLMLGVGGAGGRPGREARLDRASAGSGQPSVSAAVCTGR